MSAPTVQDFMDAFQAVPPRLRLTSLVGDINFIGPYYSQQMNNHATPARTIRDLIRNTAPLNLPQIRQLLAEYVKNQNANGCIRYRAHGAPVGQTQYHIRDFNFVAFNSLRNLLEAARRLGLGRGAHAARLPAQITGQRDEATAGCSCRQTQGTCNLGGACRWRPLARGAARAPVQGRAGFCEPVQRIRRRRGRDEGVAFPGIRRDEPGQKKRRGQAADPGQQFVGNWRVPD